MWNLIWKSSQAIVIDREKNIYLESNKKIDRLSLIWWKVEEDKDWSDREEAFERAMVREFIEETWIKLKIADFRASWKYQEPQEIPNVWMWESMYYVIILETKQETDKILENKDMKKYSFRYLETMPEDTFSMPKEKFLEHITRALNLL